MRVFAPLEPLTRERRAALDPAAAKKLKSLGLQVTVQSGLGFRSSYSDEDYRTAGAEIGEAVASADIVVRVRPPLITDITAMKRGALHVSLLDPFHQSALIQRAAEAGVSLVSLELIPRTTLAQKMDVLSSQANLAGYMSVVQAASKLTRIIPMMMTPAGTLSPARVFVVGVGVAGLQAIATARRLGARVEAFDTRPVVEEQVKSLGAKFVRLQLGDTGQTEQGYAKELTTEQLQLQRQGMARVCAQSDIVITTAKLFGKPAPRLITTDMIAGMKAGSIIVDLAAETGGNVEGSVPDQEVMTEHGVLISGPTCLEGHVAQHATQMFAANIANFLEHFWDATASSFDWRLEDEILKGCLLTHSGAVVHPRFCSGT
jgi:H+-translocating NAD(P) transhydrogenase subunit alpha